MSNIDAMSASPLDRTHEVSAASVLQSANGSPRPVAAGHGRLRPWWRRYAGVLALLDAISMILAAVVAQVLRFGTIGVDDPSTSRLTFAGVAAIMTAGWMMTMALSGAYQRRVLGAGSEEYRRVFDAGLRFVAVVAVLALMFQVDVVRGFVAIAIPIATVLSLVLRYSLRKWLHHQRRRGRFARRAVIVGSLHESQELARHISRARHAGLVPVGACIREPLEALDVDGERLEVLAQPGEVLDAVVASRADAVVIADAGTLSVGALRSLAWQLEGTGVELMVAPAVTDLAGPRISIRPVADLPLLQVEEPELKGPPRLAKEACDRVLAALGLLLFSPLLALIAVSVRVTSRGPALFRQVRVGCGGRHFVMYKFRTMVIDAEAHLAGLVHLNEHDGVLFKIRKDPRVTRLGRSLRRWSLDELPQLWNVLRGDMSIVGPRPPLPGEVERYERQVRRRLLVKPGLTGLWQVSGRSGLSWEEAVRLDLYYVENWSLSLDATIMARTVSAVVRRRGSC